MLMVLLMQQIVLCRNSLPDIQMIILICSIV